ncbi:MAG TPA: cysteine desulfurase [Candidatus Gracilibacteria bacterium]|nr:cysteine desulfurase [Candidatus Gracilibacteria bacterium]
MIDPEILKRDFPIFERKVNGHKLVYLDNASTTQKPQVVLDTLTEYYRTMNANIHRGVHTLSEEATEAYEGTRKEVAEFIGASSVDEVVFTRGATEAINLVAATWGEQNIYSGDEIVVTGLEHHSNLVPWQQLCKRKGAILKIIPLHADTTLDLSQLDSIITAKTRLVAISQMSNVTGVIIPLEQIIAAAKKVGAITVVDGAQGVPHMGINVQKTGCDFLAFSSHKMCGPTGVGVLWGRRELLDAMPPYGFGGDMVKEVTDTDATWNDLPWKFEAGTPNIADVIAFRAALTYVKKIGFENILEHDRELVKYAREQLSALPGITLYGPSDPSQGGGIVGFNVPGVHAHDVGSILNEHGVAIRTGHHCAQPLMQRLGTPATARMSFYFYNTRADIDLAVEALKKVYEIFKV